MKSRFGIRTIALVLLAACALSCRAAPATASETAALASMLERLQSVEADSTLGAAALKQGAKMAGLCANCHGANGYSTQADTPNLAGQNPRYLLGQMEKFADGRRRYEFMEGLIKAMTPQERVSVVLFYSRQKVAPRTTGDAALRAKGKAYFEQVCFRCHGADGHGSEDYARLAGQQPPYMELALKRYRNNTDGVRNDPNMADTTRMMADDDIRAVAAYVASLP